MSDALRIVVDVLAYRLRRLEMANLLAAVAIMLALRLPLPELALRTAFAFVLNLLVYLNNDYCDIEQDLSAGRESEKTRFLATHRGTAVLVQAVLAASLCAVALVFSPGLLAAVVVGGGVCVLYSAWLKRVAFADIGAMTAWGIGMTLVAFPLDRALGWALVGQLGLFSAVFETIQVVRDHDHDRRNSVTTTAVRLGVDRSIVVARAFMLVAALYGILVLHRYIALLELLAPVVPFTPDAPSRYWNRIRLVFGLAWLGILVAVFVAGGSWGLVVSLPATAVDCGDIPCRVFPSVREGFSSALTTNPLVLGIGEAHALRGSAGSESVTRRFTRELLPLLKGRASDIVVEIMLPNAGCRVEGKAAAKEQEVVTERQAKTDQGDFVALATAASGLGIRPHPLRPTCEDLGRIAAAGPDAVLESLAVVTRLSVDTLTALVAEHEKAHDERLIVGYGGAMHNDVAPRAGREQWSFGPTLRDRTSGRYVEIDLIAPEAITDSPSWRALPWVGRFDPKLHPASARLLTPDPNAFVLVFPNASIPPRGSGDAG